MACKDKTTGTWVAQWYEVDMYGKKKRRKKRGFKTMREAKLYENERTLKEQGDMNMLLKDFMEQYFEDKQNELKERSVRSKKQMMERHVIPYFGDMKMCDITAPQIIKWQNEMYKKGYSESYLRMINNQLTSLFTHAMNVYDLSNNPCKKVKRMGKDAPRSLTFWTVDEYETFLETMDESDHYYLMFEILFWTGIREGEMLALTKGDFDFVNCKLHITKTYCAIILIGHMNKNSNGKSSYRGLGSIDFQAAARSVLIVGRIKDEPEVRVVCQTKSSLAPEGKAIAFRLEKDNGFEWIGEYDISADELLNGDGKGQKSRKAKEFLLERLADGGLPQKKIEEEAEKQGIKKKTLRNAKMELEIDSVKHGNQWYWILSK